MAPEPEQDLKSLLDSLPLRYRIPLELFLEGRNYEEISAHLSISHHQAVRLVGLAMGSLQLAGEFKDIEAFSSFVQQTRRNASSAASRPERDVEADRSDFNDPSGMASSVWD